MATKIQSIHFDADVKLVNFIEERVKKLTKFFDNITGSEVILKIDKSETGENKIAEVKVFIPGNELFAKKQCKTFEEATDLAVDALKNQLVKHKEKLRGV